MSQYQYMSRQVAADILAGKLAMVQSLIDECVDIATAQDIEFSFEVGKTTVTRQTYGDVETWVNSESDWQSSNWQDSNC